MWYNKTMIFLDNASTTKPDDEIVNKFVEYQRYYFNPGANYSPSIFISKKIDKIRNDIVKSLNGEVSGTFIFTPSSTIANNTILNSVVSNNKNEEYIFSSLEHPSVYNIANKLLLSGRKVKFVDSLPSGEIDEKQLLSMINENTKFVSLINVSNETGVVNNVNELSKKIKGINPKTLVHSDGVQAFGKIETSVKNLDFYTISNHKIYGLKGIAGFYCKNLKSLKTLILGGGQEFDIISGTTNAPMIFSFFDAIKNAEKNLTENFEKVLELNKILRSEISKISDVEINSPEVFKNLSSENKLSCYCSPYILSISVLGLNAETIQNMLSKAEIYVGLGSACSAKKSGNRVLLALKKTKSEILGNIRISLSKNTTKEEIETFIEELKSCILKLKENL